jgi:outer membrane protein assembly factor BamB
VISALPVRSGVLVDSDRAYFFSGLFPKEGVYGCALQAEDGSLLWKNRFEQISPQGYILSSRTRLFVPTGRTMPTVISKDKGALAGSFAGTGGTYALLVDDYIYSQADREGHIGLSDATTHERIATFDGVRVIVKGNDAYLQTQQELMELDRIRHTQLARQHNQVARQLENLKQQLKSTTIGKKKALLEKDAQQAYEALSELDEAMSDCFTWRQLCHCPYELILAGDVLFAGGADKVVAIQRSDGKVLWEGAVRGRAYGLSVANGRLFVSTDQAVIHCFSPTETRAVADSSTQPTGEGSPYPDDDWTLRYAAAAEEIVRQTAIQKGYCLVLGSGEGRLAYELATRTDLHIVGIDEDVDRLAAARSALTDAGLYGSRIALQQGGLDQLPYTPYLFNLVVSDRMLRTGEPPSPASEVFRVLRPSGGVACLGGGGTRASRPDQRAVEQWLSAGRLPGSAKVTRSERWTSIHRGPIPDGGEWTQLYANPSHTASSQDALRGPMVIQWFGKPGPRRMVDRHHRPMSSLVKDGRVFIPGNNVIFAADAYNGTPMWQLEVPDMRRVGALKDSGQMLVTDDTLYIAVRDECWLVDVQGGKRTGTLKVPQIEGAKSDWGYLNQLGDQLVGTAQAAGASFSQLHKDMVNLLEGDFRPVIASRYLFSVDRHTGQHHWTYRRGTLMNSAIAVGAKRLYFIESRSDGSSSEEGRIGIREFCAEPTFLVSLDPTSGRKLYEQAVQLPFQHIMFLNYAENTVLLSGTYNRGDKVYYSLIAFVGDTGELKWETEYLALDIRGNEVAPTEGSHGEQWQHPVIINDRIYSRPYDFDLQTGRKGEKTIRRGGHGCGGWTASAHYLFGRGSNPRMYDLGLQSTEGDPLTVASRPGCWLNIIPAGGLVLIPESSSGCTCSYPLQTSLAFIPQNVLSRDQSPGSRLPISTEAP